MTISGKTVAVLGINGAIGQYAARAFVAAGWQVTGMGRSNKQPILGVRFVKGDAENVADMQAAIGDSAVVVNALNLPYDKWFGGALERQIAKVIEATGTSGRTLLYPGSIYNYAASVRDVTPDQPQHPERPRGELRKRCETMLQQAAERGDIQAIVIRAGDFYAPHVSGWFDQGILAQKGKIAAPSELSIGHSWAYLPDLARAFEKLAWHPEELGAFESFHFGGHFATSGELVSAIQQAASVPLRVTRLPWGMLRMIGLVNPMMREISKMRYLWQNPMRLRDERLEAILGPDFVTPFNEAIAVTVAPLLETMRKAA